MLSPNIGLTKGKDVLLAALAAINATNTRMEMQNNLARIIRLGIMITNPAPKKQKAGEMFLRLLLKDLAATYSRGSYTTTTIGKAAFDGRVRNGIGSDHSFMTTKIVEG